MPNLLKMLSGSGLCADSLTSLEFHLNMLAHPLLRYFAMAARLKFSPAILDRIRCSPLPLDEKSALFSRAMNLFRAGGAYKTTGACRTPLADAEVLRADRPGALILETGVSDGTSATGLLAGAAGAEVMLSDLQAGFPYSAIGPLRIYFGAEDGYTALKLGPLYLCTGSRPGGGTGTAMVSALNPALEEKFGIRSILPFDVFSSVLPRPADAIKCANVLNLVYFPPERIRAALVNLRRSLAAGGLLVISHNNGKYQSGEAVITLRNSGGRLTLDRERNAHELLPYLASSLFADIMA